MNTLFIAILSIALSVAAQFSLKAGMSGAVVQEVLMQAFTFRTVVTVLTDKFVLGGFLLYGLGAVVWLGVLSKWDVSKAYPLVGLGFAFTVAIGLMAGEQVTLLRLTGVSLICAGVFLVSQS
jgi:multidrug transporter EmrE-like cation transporter